MIPIAFPEQINTATPLSYAVLGLAQDSASGHPIGHGHAEPIAEKQECAVLDHKSEAEHLASIVRGNTELKTSDEFKGLLVRLVVLRRGLKTTGWFNASLD